MHSARLTNKKIEALVLFDIDGTLVWNFPEHKEAFCKAFKEVYHLDCNIDCINPQGMTDQRIALEVLKKNGLKEKEIKTKMSRFMQAAASFFNKIDNKNCAVVLPGVKELLDKLQQNSVMLGLVTGNLKSIAKGKLKRMKLEKYFRIGGFGSDDIKRTNLVKIAIKQAAILCGYEISRDRVYVIGDTPKDIKAAKEAKTKVIAVATGQYTMKDLQRFKPDYTFRNLTPTEKIVRVILANR